MLRRKRKVSKYFSSHFRSDSSTWWHSAKIGDLRRRAHVHNTVNRPLNVFWVIHTAFLCPAALRAPLCHRSMGPRRQSEVALVAGLPSDFSSCEDTKPCLRCAIPKWSAHTKCNQHLKAARGGRSCNEEDPCHSCWTAMRAKRCVDPSAIARDIVSDACCEQTQSTALTKAARAPAARVRPRTNKRNFVICLQKRSQKSWNLTRLTNSRRKREHRSSASKSTHRSDAGSARRLVLRRPLLRRSRPRRRCRLQPSRLTSATALRRLWGLYWTDWTTATPASKRTTNASCHLSMPIHPCVYNSVYK